MRWLFVTPLRPFVLLAAAASLLLNLALLVPSIVTLQVFDRVFASRSVETLAMLGLLTLLALAFGYGMDVARANALAAAGRTLDELLSPAALRQALQRAAASRGRGDADRLRDIARLRQFLAGHGVQALFDAPWLPIYLVVISLMHPLLGLAAGAGALVLALLAVATERLTRDRADEAQRDARAAARQSEALTRHAELIVGMGMTGGAVGTWQARQDRALDAQARLAARVTRLAALARMGRQGVQMAVLGVGAALVIGADASPGIMIAATILLGRALQPVEHLIGGWKQLVEARSAWSRLCEPQPGIAGEPSLRLPVPAGRLVLERVVFSHDRHRPALIKGLSMALEPGESLGIVGASGSGKTTLVRLLLGLWQPQAGVVRLDGADIGRRDRDDLGAHLGYLPQDVALLGGTVAQNIARLGRLDADEVVAAARLAQAHELILRLPEGYETVVGEGGVALSGGQRQRIALARALYGQPRLVVLDEPDAHLDAEGESALKAALRELKARGTTVVAVGHRVGLMAQLDKLAVIKDGALEAFGPATAVLARLRGVPAVRALPAHGSQQEVAA